MSENEKIELSDKLNKALKESYHKMIDLKKIRPVRNHFRQAWKAHGGFR